MDVQESIYYVYVYLDPRKPGNYFYGDYKFKHEPFYVGKGKGNRIFDHLKKHDGNYRKSKIINEILKNTNDIPIILKECDNLIECDALNLEEKLIKDIGRIDLGTGPLINMTDGGESNSGSNNPKSKKMYQYDFKGNLIKEWNYIAEFFKQNNIQISSRLYQIVNYNGNLNVDKSKGYKLYKNFGVFSFRKLDKKGFKIYFYNDGVGKDNPFFGKHHTEETKKKIADSRRGKKHTEESKKKIGDAQRGRKKHTEESKKKIGEALKGNKHPLFGKFGKDHPSFGKHHSEKTKEKIRKSKIGKNYGVFGKNHPNFGKHHSEETKKKMSDALKGNKNPFFGKHHSEETKKKIQETLKNKNG